MSAAPVYIGKIFITSENVIKVFDEHKATVSGFDIISETFIEVEKSHLREIPQSVMRLLTCERAQVMIADREKKIKQKAAVLGISERQIHRLLIKHNLKEVKNVIHSTHGESNKEQTGSANHIQNREEKS